MNFCSKNQTVRTDDFYSAVFESIEEGIVVIGLDRKIIFINKMAGDLIGLDGVVAEGALCSEILKTDLCAETCPLESQNISNSSCASHFMNINLLKNDKSSVPLCLNVAPLKDKNGKMIGIIENFRPMSEAVKIIESLEQSNVILAQEKNKIDSIINSLADGVFTVDKNLRITNFNKGMENITGHKEQEVIGSRCNEIFNADNCGRSCPFSYTLKNGYGMANVSERIVGKNGELVPIFMSTAFLRDNGKDIGLIATVRDASEIERLKKEVNDRYHFSNIIGKSSRMQQIFEVIESLRDTDCSVLIEGESGTGKELTARAIHHEGYRRNKPFVKIDCSAIVEGLFESELFGHVKGAFTGAIKDKNGKFEIADGGTVFLDEIGEMPLTLQAKLLRVIQDMEFERVGDTKTRKVDVNIIAATNKKLKNEIKNSMFREDLYYRLCVVPIEMPPLRERIEDIPLLVENFLARQSSRSPNRPGITEVTPSAMSILMDYDWPGNIRELENAIEHACIRSRSNIIDREALPHNIRPVTKKELPAVKNIDLSLKQEQTERLFIEDILKKHNGNRTLAAKEIGLSRTTFWRKLKKHNLQA